MGEDSADLIALKVPGVPSQPARAPRSRWSGWSPGLDHERPIGVSFRAASVEPAIAQAKAS
jgi:hypothetical protein